MTVNNIERRSGLALFLIFLGILAFVALPAAFLVIQYQFSKRSENTLAPGTNPTSTIQSAPNAPFVAPQPPTAPQQTVTPAPATPTVPSAAPPPIPVSPPSNPDMFGAIEIGSSGVKANVFNMTQAEVGKVISDEARENGFRYKAFDEFRRKKYDTFDTKLADPKSIPGVAGHVKQLTEDMYKDFGIPKSRIFVVASSGVGSLAHIADIRKAVADAAGIIPDVISPERECNLVFDWIVPGGRLTQAVVIDIGSGNTKACYGETEKSRRSFELLPIGTKTHETAVKATLKPGQAFDAASAAARPAIAGTVSDAASANAGLRTRKRLYLVGGIIWATATLVRPKEAGDDWVTLSVPDDFYTLRKRAVEGRAYALDEAAVDKPTVLEMAKKDAGRIPDVFTPDQLISGLDISIAITEALKVKSEKDAVFFARPADNGWLQRYLIEKVAGIGDAATP